MYKIITQYSLWYFVFCILAGLVYAYLLYQQKSPWSKRINYLLAGLRFLLVTFLAFLFLSPLINYFNNQIEKPIVVIGIDNSTSMRYSTKNFNTDSLKKNISALKNYLASNDIEVEIHTLSKSKTAIDSISFSKEATNIDGFLSNLKSTFENRNLSQVVFISDGIYNQGADPTYQIFNFPIHCIGLGDTIPKKDILIKSCSYNKLSYKDNLFPINIDIQNYGFKNEKTEVLLKEGNKIIDSKTISFASNDELVQLDFLTSTKEIGIKHYTVELKKINGEYSVQNNVAHVYIDIIENKEKILVIAPSPHPDIKALRSAISKKEHYEFILHIPGINEYKEDNYDLVILHQLPDNYNTAKNLIDNFVTKKIPLLFILGNQTNINQFNGINSILTIQTKQTQKDLVLPEFNAAYERFSITPEEKNIISKYPPLIVPYGEYKVSGRGDVCFYQKIGNIASDRPLIITSNDRKIGVIGGEGIWLWRQHEYLETHDVLVFDNLINNIVQFLSTKEDKRKFRIYPISESFDEGESVFLETETYNDVYVKTFNHKINLQVTDEKGKITQYSYSNGETNSRFEIKGLTEGSYKFSGTTDLSGKNETAVGKFIVKSTQLEGLNTTANFDLLRLLSQKSGGVFSVGQASINNLGEYILNTKPKSKMHTQEELVDFINFVWLFFVFLGLVSLEWFLRKYYGSY